MRTTMEESLTRGVAQMPPGVPLLQKRAALTYVACVGGRAAAFTDNLCVGECRRHRQRQLRANGI